MNLFAIIVLLTASNNNTDSIIRGVYLNPWQASKKDYLKKIFAKADSGYINAIVVDLKSDYGYLCYDSEIKLAKKIKAVKQYIDIGYLVEHAQKHNLKLIARVVCFRDNYLAQYKDYGIIDDQGDVWKDKTGTAWVNPYVDGVADYLVSIIQEIKNLGIESIALDYIRFPTDGSVKRIRLVNVKGPRNRPIIDFLKKIRKQVDIEIGICIFGYAVWYDLKSEGQDVEQLGAYVDVVYPMLYPSHFPAQYKNDVDEYWRNYWIYFDSVIEAFTKLPLWVKVVPFVQGFGLFAENYGCEYIAAQIYGAFGAYADGFLIWNAASNYATSWQPLWWARNSVLNRCVPNCLDTRMREILHRYRDIVPPASLSQGQNQTKNQTTPWTDSLIGTQPSEKIRKFLHPDQIPLW